MTVVRQRIRNSSMQGSGALGIGDRGGGQTVAFDSTNPYNTNDFVRRWRSYVQMYETSWEARKIVRIIPEDALRKDWIIEDMPEGIMDKLREKEKRLNFLPILSRSLMLERLLGGCLTFMGLEDNEDEPKRAFSPSSGRRLHFLNAIPLSRISRVNWDTNPLSEYYMRPNMYLVNGQNVHASRCLVWDGDPLFDPYDFALTNFRVNLAGFGPSKLAPIWDDIVKAVGTRQAAYQLIQVNNAILVAVNELQDLQGTKTGKAALAKVKDIANQISTYRAAVIDADKVDVQQKAASFGSVPELILTFVQILSAASDIPATRFIGQAPGGLNATGESDLENYYNVIDAYQRNRIEPNIRRIYDVIGFSTFPNEWKKIRKEYSIKFPPMWNSSELEEAQAATAQIENAMSLFDRNLMSEEKVIEEINAKNALSITLDSTDIGIIDEAGEETNPQEEIDKLKGKQFQVPSNFSVEPDSSAAPGSSDSVPLSSDQQEPGAAPGRVRNAIDPETDFLKELMKEAGNAPDNVSIDQFKKGMKVEQEHAKTVDNDTITIAKIALDHLAEDPQYYTKLEKVEGKGAHVTNIINLPPLPEPTKEQIKTGKYKKHHLKLHGLDLAVENPKGSVRRGTDPNGEEWEAELPAHYGYVKRTEGADGDEVDIFIGPQEESELVFVVDQKDPDTGEFDEHKVIFGTLSMTQAKELYLDAFTDGKASQRIGGITPMHVDQFKQWLSEGDTKKPHKVINRKRKRK